MSVPHAALRVPTWDEYQTFHQLSIVTWDVDPSWPVYKRLADDLCLDRQDHAWLAMLHVIYYHYGSVLTAFDLVSHPRDIERLPVLPTGKNRRGHRSPVQLRRHLVAMHSAWSPHGGSLLGWLESVSTATRVWAGSAWSAP